MPHPAQPRHTNYWAPRTRKRHRQEHWLQRPTKRSDPTQHAKGRPGDCPAPRKDATTRRNVTQGGRARRYPASGWFSLPKTHIGTAVSPAHEHHCGSGDGQWSGRFCDELPGQHGRWEVGTQEMPLPNPTQPNPPATELRSPCCTHCKAGSRHAAGQRTYLTERQCQRTNPHLFEGRFSPTGCPPIPLLRLTQPTARPSNPAVMLLPLVHIPLNNPS